MFSRVVTVILCLLPVVAMADKDYFYECKHREKTRIIEVTYEALDKQVPCSVRYHKATGSDQLWTASNIKNYCEAKAAEFAEKQEGWGWTCEMVSEYYNPESEQLHVASKTSPVVASQLEPDLTSDDIDQTSCYTEYCRQVEILLAKSDARVRELEEKLEKLVTDDEEENLANEEKEEATGLGAL